MRRLRRSCVLILLASVTSPLAACAQGYPFSQRGSVSQTVAFTEISIRYGRPVARGRTLFGQLVPWDSVWHPGADSATIVAIDHDLLVEGQTLPAGEYSIWLIPRERAPWTVIFSRTAHTFHRPYPGAQHDAMRLAASPEEGAHLESLAFYFPVVLRDEATLRFHWGRTIVPLHLKAAYRPE